MDQKNPNFSYNYSYSMIKLDYNSNTVNVVESIKFKFIHFIPILSAHVLSAKF